LDIIDIIRAKVVCSSWNSLGEELVPRTPWLMLPSKEVEGGYDVDNNAYSGFLKLGESQQYLREYFIRKAILTGEPYCNNKKYDVNKLRNDEKIAYHDNEDRYWTEAPDARHPPYQDIICHENQLLALGEGNNIEIWNFQDGFMRNIRYTVPPFPEKLLAKRNSLRDLCTSWLYLVES
ncbi:hypothetical protein QUC31_016388, partial [Theobroma cacao]